jgi:phosphoribosylformylglycinamidine synthase II
VSRASDPSLASPPVTAALLAEVGLTPAEYERLVALLGRQPNLLELGMVGAMWSEHCSYKSSRHLLRRLPTTGPRVLQGPGENAGAVDLGDGLAVVMKIESHNHPSAVEPFQGAATGVGGILRDVFTMGARPVALLDSLHFGPLDEPRNRYLFENVVAGIAHYGNCVGVPTVAGEVHFAPGYRANPLVNAMCVGLAPHHRLTRARARGPGNPVLLVGAATGRDGIHGATFASAELDARSEERRPAVQVGNPFLEKLLLEACLALLETGDVIAMQDLGAAGLTSASAELAGRGGCGIEIDVARVSRREAGMTPYEVMLSESQERMLVVVAQGAETRAEALFTRWGLHTDRIGQITADGLLRVRDGTTVVAELPVRVLTADAPLYERPQAPPPPPPVVDPATVPVPADLGAVLLALLGSPNLCSRAPVFTQYDHTVQANTVIPPGRADAAVLRVRGTSKGLALTVDSAARYAALDPRRGAALAVAEAARNLSCCGAEPLAVTDCLNLANPERPPVAYALAETIEGLREACLALEIPVISGNVSLYNETEHSAVPPTAVVGMAGVLADVTRAVDAAFKAEGDCVVLLGTTQVGLGGSEYLAVIHGRTGGPPPALDLAYEARLQRCCRTLVTAGLVRSAHDCAEGGLAVAVAESALLGERGFVADPDWAAALGARPDLALFGEGPSRIVVSCRPEDLPAVTRAAAEAGVEAIVLGRVAGDRLVWPGAIDVALAEAQARWEAGLLAPAGLPLEPPSARPENAAAHA